MTTEQRDLIPDHLLAPSRTGAGRLITWLHTRGWRLSLAELEDERRKRGLR